MKGLLVLGAGGHGQVVADCAMETGSYSTIAFLDDHLIGQVVLGCSVVGTFGDAAKLRDRFGQVAVAVGDNRARARLLEALLKMGFVAPALFHPKACVSKFTRLGSGAVVLAGGTINAGADIGIGCIINTAASVDHHCVIGKAVHISPGARIGGSVKIGDFTWVGIGASVINNLTVGSGVIVAAGAVLTRDFGDSILVAGVPAVEKRAL